jgi:hypothetical protein
VQRALRVNIRYKKTNVLSNRLDNDQRMFENVAKGSIPIFEQKSFYLRTQAPLTTKKMPIFKKNFQVVTGAFIHIKQK